MKKFKKGQFVAFGFNYNGGEHDEIIVDRITMVMDNQVLVHFLYGHKSLSEWIHNDDVIAIGNSKSSAQIKGWTGNFDILKPEHPLLKK